MDIVTLEPMSLIEIYYTIDYQSTTSSKTYPVNQRKMTELISFDIRD